MLIQTSSGPEDPLDGIRPTSPDPLGTRCRRCNFCAAELRGVGRLTRGSSTNPFFFGGSVGPDAQTLPSTEARRILRRLHLTEAKSEAVPSAADLFWHSIRGEHDETFLLVTFKVLGPPPERARRAMDGLLLRLCNPGDIHGWSF